jgi:hypothetical protein
MSFYKLYIFFSVVVQKKDGRPTRAFSLSANCLSLVCFLMVNTSSDAGGGGGGEGGRSKSEPEFSNFYGAQESIPRNQFCQHIYCM